MAYSALLELEGKKFKVRHCAYSLHQNLDENGRPTTNVMGGTINCEIESSDDDTIVNWMVDPVGKKSGSIVFMKTSEEGEMKKITFDDAFCTSYTETMNSLSNEPMVEHIIISAQKLMANGVAHENIWESRM